MLCCATLFHHAVLRHAVLRHAVLCHAVLCSAVLGHAALFHAVLRHAVLRLLVLRHSTTPCSAALHRAMLRRAVPCHALYALISLCRVFEAHVHRNVSNSSLLWRFRMGVLIGVTGEGAIMGTMAQLGQVVPPRRFLLDGLLSGSLLWPASLGGLTFL